MTWEQRMTDLGLSEDKLSRRVKERISDYRDIEKALAEKRKQFKTAEGKEKEKLQDHIDTMESGLRTLDKHLVKDVERLKKNGPTYDRLKGNLKKSGKAKAAAEPAKEPAKPAEPAKEPEPVKTAAATATQGAPATNNSAPKSTTATQPTPPKPPTPPGAATKKKDNTVGIVLGVVATIALAFFGFRYFRGKS